MNAYRFLIIEDEPLAARRMQKLLEELGYTMAHYERCESVAESVAWLQSHPAPDLIFQDIELADGPCFSIYETVRPDCPIIFTTAYHEHALRAFSLNSIDYVLKPIEVQDLKRAMDKFERLRAPIAAPVLDSVWKALQHKPAYRQRLLVQKGEDLISLAVSEITWLRSEDKMTLLMRDTGEKFWLHSSLDELQDELDPEAFFRLNRGVLASRGAIQKVAVHLNGKLKVQLRLAPDADVLVSRERASDFKRWLGA